MQLKLPMHQWKQSNSSVRPAIGGRSGTTATTATTTTTSEGSSGTSGSTGFAQKLYFRRDVNKHVVYLVQIIFTIFSVVCQFWLFDTLSSVALLFGALTAEFLIVVVLTALKENLVVVKITDLANDSDLAMGAEPSVRSTMASAAPPNGGESRAKSRASHASRATGATTPGKRSSFIGVATSESVGVFSPNAKRRDSQWSNRLVQFVGHRIKKVNKAGYAFWQKHYDAHLLSRLVRTIVWCIMYVYATTHLYRESSTDEWNIDAVPQVYFIVERMLLWLVNIDFCAGLLASMDKKKFLKSHAALLDLIFLPPFIIVVRRIWNELYGEGTFIPAIYLMNMGWARFLRLYGTKPIFEQMFVNISIAKLHLIAIVLGVCSILFAFAGAVFTVESPCEEGGFLGFFDFFYYAVVTIKASPPKNFRGQEGPAGVRWARFLSIIAVATAMIWVPRQIAELMKLLNAPLQRLGSLKSAWHSPGGFVLLTGSCPPQMLRIWLEYYASFKRSSAPRSVVYLYSGETPIRDFVKLRSDMARNCGIRLFVVQGDLALNAKEDIIKVHLSEAWGIVIFSDPCIRFPVQEDRLTIMRALAARKFFPMDCSSLVLNQNSAQLLAMDLGVPSVVVLNELKMKILGKTASGCRGFSTLLSNLFHHLPETLKEAANREEEEKVNFNPNRGTKPAEEYARGAQYSAYQVRVPKDHVDCSFTDAVQHLLALDVVLMGVRRDGCLSLNPGPEFKLDGDDWLVCMLHKPSQVGRIQAGQWPKYKVPEDTQEDSDALVGTLARLRVRPQKLETNQKRAIAQPLSRRCSARGSDALGMGRRDSHRGSEVGEPGKRASMLGDLPALPGGIPCGVPTSRRNSLAIPGAPMGLPMQAAPSPSASSGAGNQRPSLFKRRHSHTPNPSDEANGPVRTSSNRGNMLPSMAAIGRPASAQVRRKSQMAAVESPNKFRHSVVAQSTFKHYEAQDIVVQVHDVAEARRKVWSDTWPPDDDNDSDDDDPDEDHSLVLICGWPRSLFTFLRTLLSCKGGREACHVIVLAPEVPSHTPLHSLAEFAPAVVWVQGSALKSFDLLRAGVLDADSVICFACQHSDESAVVADDSAYSLDVESLLSATKVVTMSKSARAVKIQYERAQQEKLERLRDKERQRRSSAGAVRFSTFSAEGEESEMLESINVEKVPSFWTPPSFSLNLVTEMKDAEQNLCFLDRSTWLPSSELGVQAFLDCPEYAAGRVWMDEILYSFACTCMPGTLLSRYVVPAVELAQLLVDGGMELEPAPEQAQPCLQLVPVPKHWHGRQYGHLQGSLISQGAIPLGLYRQGSEEIDVGSYVATAPVPTLVLQKTDRVYVIPPAPIDLVSGKAPAAAFEAKNSNDSALAIAVPQVPSLDSGSRRSAFNALKRRSLSDGDL